MNLYTIFDNVALECGPIFEAVNDGVALRSYNNLLEETKKQYPDSASFFDKEYELYRVAVFDKATMKVDGVVPSMISVTKVEVE